MQTDSADQTQTRRFTVRLVSSTRNAAGWIQHRSASRTLHVEDSPAELTRQALSDMLAAMEAAMVGKQTPIGTVTEKHKIHVDVGHQPR